MSLRTRFFIYLTIVHLVFFAGAVYFLREKRPTEKSRLTWDN